MALTRKTGPAQAVSLIGEIPDPPKTPKEVLDRFESMAEYQSSLDIWWSNFKDMLQRDRSQVQAQFQKDEADAATSLRTINNSITTLRNQVDALAANSTGNVAGQIAAIQTALTAVENDVAAHILSSIAHKTSSDIVGKDDEQDLTWKSIGTQGPRYGRFSSLVSLSSIPVGEIVTINFGETMIVGGDFNVLGTLVIDGTLVAV